jgi:copper oxidase (laccase) domain-containing protein
MAAELGVAPDRLPPPNPFPDVVTVERPWGRSSVPRRRDRDPVPGLAIGVTTADCGPVLLADDTAGVIAAHAGWRGAATGVLEATVAAMERCGADRAHRRGARADDPAGQLRGRAEFVAHFGPTTGEAFPALAAAGSCAVRPAGYRRRLAAARIAWRISGIAYADARVFSYRRSTHRRERTTGVTSMQ